MESGIKHKVIIAGGRDFNNYPQLSEYCDYILQFQSALHPIEIVSGCANGADKLGERYADSRGYDIKRFPADWDKFGKSAGYKRNKQMAEYADTLIAFWDGKSRGTKHMIDLAEENRLEVRVYNYGKENN